VSLLHIRGNALGLAMVVLGGVIAGVGSLVLRLGDATVMLMIGLAVIASDLIIRLRSRALPGWLTRSEYGGILFFLPMWVIGMIAVAGAIANAITP
jgi:hypothetical protein